MSLVTEQVNGFMANSSWIRKMFEAGIELKKKYGNDAVCDFSLGNPDLPPPATVKQALFGIAEKADLPFSSSCPAVRRADSMRCSARF